MDDRVVSVCIKALSDADRNVQIAATEAVASLEITDASVLERLAENLVDDPELLRATLNAISEFGGKAGASGL